MPLLHQPPVSHPPSVAPPGAPPAKMAGQQQQAQALKVPLYDIEKNAMPATVCVTGATGYVAGSIIQRLLATGHTVHATCRAPEKEESVAHLKAFPGADKNLKLFKADLLTPGAFDESIQGCDYVLHTASPYTLNVKPAEVQAKLLDPAIQGTENVLGSVNRSPSVRRVVLTSSVAAIYGNPMERGPNHVFTEEDWCTTPSATVMPYYYSKRLAEEKAWEMCKAQARWQLVTVNPGAVFGPPQSGRADGESIGIMRQMLSGMMFPAAPNLGFGIVDVRDVAAAQCVAMVHPKAQGRYIATAGSEYVPDLARKVKESYPSFWAPVTTVPKWLLWAVGPYMGMGRDMVNNGVNMKPEFDNSKIKRELGLQFLDVKDTMGDMVEAMGRLGISKPLKK